jgi:uncharacterized protein
LVVYPEPPCNAVKLRTLGSHLSKMLQATPLHSVETQLAAFCCVRPDYNSPMSLIEQIQKDITTAMKARDEQRLSCLRMVKTALKNREIDKMAPLDDKEAQQVLSTLIKQRKESVEQFSKGGRQEMADKEAAEIKLIETYLPKAASEEQIVAGVKAVIAEMGSPTMKDIGTVMKNVMARFASAGARVDGKQVSEAVKRELTRE